MKHWIFIANDNSWDWLKNQKVGEIEPWNALTDKGKLKRFFSLVQTGDKVIGYSSGKTKAFVALGVIENQLATKNGHKVIEIMKTDDLIRPLSLERVMQIAPFDKKLHGVKLNTTVIPLELDEYNKLISMISDTFLDNYDNVDTEFNTSNIELAEALKLRPNKDSNLVSSWFRDSRISKAAIIRANFKCELSSNINTHDSFIASFTNKNYVEAHHLIPLKEQAKFDFSLDNALNIVSLCPNCHKLVHYGEISTRKEKISELFDKRGKDIGVYKISKEELLKMYE